MLTNVQILSVFTSSVNPFPSETEWHSVERTACASTALAHWPSQMNLSKSKGRVVSPASALLSLFCWEPRDADSNLMCPLAQLAHLANQVSVRSMCPARMMQFNTLIIRCCQLLTSRVARCLLLARSYIFHLTFKMLKCWIIAVHYDSSATVLSVAPSPVLIVHIMPYNFKLLWKNKRDFWPSSHKCIITQEKTETGKNSGWDEK